jgi:hypothetical protein
MATIVTRAGKGSPLTHNEVDANFTNLNSDKLESGDTVASLTLTSVDINGGTIDGVTLGTNSAVTETQIDNLNINGNAITSTDTDGNIALTPNGTGEVDISKVDIDGGTIDGTVIGGSTPAAVTGTTITATGDVDVADKITHTGDTDTSIRFPAADTVTVETAGSERVRVDSSGNVGIGTNSPDALLHVANGNAKIRVGLTASDGHLDISRSSSTGIITYDAAQPTFGAHVFSTAASERMRIAGNGRVGIGTSSPGEKLDVSGNVTISGSLSKGSGSFKIDHPIKPETHHLVHSFIEGPQADNIYRGKVALVGGTATVNLDEAGRMTEGTFVALNGNVQCFTTNEGGWTAVRGAVDGNILTIEAQDATCTDTVSWLVIGERHDQHMIDADWTDEQGRIITEPEKVTAS